MLSLLTNSSALQAMRSLSQTQRDLNSVETEAATGLKISTASDSPAYWSIGAKMNSQVAALGTVSDALSESAAMVSVTSTALNSTISVLEQMRNDLISASQPNANLAAIDTDIAARQTELVSIGESATFNGQNWLAYQNAAPSPSGYAGGGVEFYADGSVLYSSPPPPLAHPARIVDLVSGYSAETGVSTISIDTNDIQLFGTAPAFGVLGDQGILGYSSITVGDVRDIRGASDGGGAPYKVSVLQFSIASASSDDIANMLNGVEQAIDTITTATSALGGTLKQINAQQGFVSNLSDTLRVGMGALIDADMDDVSTRISALQVQQQLGITALSIANSNASSVLQLFK